MYNQRNTDRLGESSRYVQELGRVLRTQDIRQVKQFVFNHERLYPTEVLEPVLRDELILEIAMHQAICIRTDLTDLKQESLEWLQSRGYRNPLLF